MGMACRGITHCYRCFKPLGDHEGGLCKNCEQEQEKEKEERKIMIDCGSLCEEYNKRFNEEVEIELNKKDIEKMSKAFKKGGINIENKEFEDLMRKIIQEELDKRENKQENKENYEIKRFGNLSLCYKTFINRVAEDDEIEICMWNKDFTSRWTIASFEYDEDYNYYKLNSCGDRLNDSNIDWRDFGILVREGYEILNDFID